MWPEESLKPAEKREKKERGAKARRVNLKTHKMCSRLSGGSGEEEAAERVRAMPMETVR